MAFQRAESQFFFLVGSSEEKLQWRGWGGGDEHDVRASLRNQIHLIFAPVCIRLHILVRWQVSRCSPTHPGLNLSPTPCGGHESNGFAQATMPIATSEEADGRHGSKSWRIINRGPGHHQLHIFHLREALP